MTSSYGNLPRQNDDDEGQEPSPPEEQDEGPPRDWWSSTAATEPHPPEPTSEAADRTEAADTAWSRDYARRPGDVPIVASVVDRDAEPVAQQATPATAVALEEAPEQTAPTQKPMSTGRKARRVVWELTQTLVLAAVIFMMVRGVAQNFRVEGPSMEPGLHDGQYLLVNKAVYFKIDVGNLSRYIPFINADDNDTRYLFHPPKRGDVVVFRYPRDPNRDFIKRIIGIPGDTVQIDQGMVSVNGVLLDEPYINEGSTFSLEPRTVPPNSYFVMGDNRPNSSDSRNWGFVPEENIIGKAMFSYWPLSDLGGIGNRSIDLGIIKLPLP